MVILEENEGYGQIIGSSSAPYLNSLATTYASATNWYAVQGNSPHDYLDLIVGSDLGLPKGQPYSTTTLVDELHADGISSRAYVESMPSNCAKGSSSNGLYDTNHNPFVHFTKYSSSTGGWCSSANLSTEGIVPYPGSSGLVSALNGAGAPDFVFLVPNDCDEMHGDTSTGSPCGSNSNSQLIKAGDTWLSNNLGPVLGSAWFQQNGIIIITWDEAANGDHSGCCGLSSPGGRIATIVVAAGNKGSGTFTGTGDHFGTLRAIEESYDVGFLGGSSNSANGDLSGAFGSAPTTGSIIGTVTDAQTKAGIAGVTVTCSCATGGMTTGAGGSYAFSNVTPGNNFSLTFSDTGYVGQTVNNVAVAAGKATTKNAALTEDGSIGGQVTDAATQLPIANATVTCTCHSGSATTDGAGDYAFSNVTPANNYVMTVSASGYSPQNINSVAVNAGQATTENLALSSTPGSIAGVVSDATATSHPVLANVNVTCTCQTASVATDGTGSYSFTNVTPGSYSLTFTDPGYATLAVNNVGVFASAQTTESASLSEDGGVTGVVTDGTAVGNPVLAGVTVTCTCQVGSASTDGTGSYTFSDVAPGTYSLIFTDPGFVPLSVSGLSVTAGTQTTQGASLIEGGGVTGVVTDGTAGVNPVLAGVTVTCTCEGGSVSSDGMGSYTFSDVAPGTYSLTFTDPGFVSQTIDSVAVIAGTQTTENASLSEDGMITGTVTDAGTHQAISNATVTCTCQAAAVTTNAAGVYNFTDVTPASYTLSITAGGYAGQGTAPFTVSPGLAAVEDFQLTALASPLNVVQSFGIAAKTASTTLSATTGTATGTGDLLVITIKGRSSSPTMVTGISDSSSGLNTWVRATGVQHGQADEEIWYAANATPVTKFTVDVSLSASLAMTVVDIAGASATTPLDRTMFTTGSSTAASTGSTSATSQPNEIVIADIGWNSTVTLSGATAGYTDAIRQQSTASGNQTGEQAAWLIVSATGPQGFAATLSSSVAWLGAVATFK